VTRRISARIQADIAPAVQALTARINAVEETAQKEHVEAMLALGRLHAQRVASLGPHKPLREAEFKVFSQWGEDGILQYLIRQIEIPNEIFVEFGVENYRESNTRFLLINDNWRGLVMDGSEAYMQFVRQEPLYWRYDLIADAQFVTRENINELIGCHVRDQDIGILSIDIDGNDYWVWDATTVVSPRIVVCEYNSVFGPHHAITIPYAPAFNRSKAHYSNLYWGTSLSALCHLASRKGYVFVGSNSAGCNAFFVRKDVASNLQALTPADGYVESRYRESRDREGNLTYVSGRRRIEQIGEMEVYDVIAQKLLRISELEV
jgi:hypothetical protein